MKYVAIFISSGPISLYVLWLYYLAVMNLKRVNDISPLIGFRKWVAISVKWTGLALDVYVNLFWMTIIFLSIPNEWLVTDCFIRHKNESLGWRKSLAEWFCRELLDDFDPTGCHCK